MRKYVIKDIQVVNEGSVRAMDVLVEDGRIARMDGVISSVTGHREIVGAGRYLLPGAIDDQVHFREPGLTHKANIASESMAAVAGGVTSFMEMPNTRPPALTHALLEEKYAIGKATSLANYSFFMGTSNDNVEEVLRTNARKKDVCGVKIFMGSSTGNMLVDDHLTLDRIFRDCEVLIATHCEDERIIAANLARIRSGKQTLEAADHPRIRDTESCFESSLTAIQYAKRHGTRLHILHISTAKELQLFGNMLPLEEKRITCEVCVHHLHFTDADYAVLGDRIKCNPAIKSPENREGLWKALLDDTIDVIATDHAPHTVEEKSGGYGQAHAGLPLVQHGLPLMLHYHRQGRISLEHIVKKMAHDVAACFRISERGYIREGYHADLVIVDPDRPFTVGSGNILYKCGWSPFEGFTFPSSVTHTFVSGHLAYEEGRFDTGRMGMRLAFDR